MKLPMELVAFCAAVCVSAAPALGQEPIQSWPLTLECAGYPIDSIADLDGDDFRDLLLGSAASDVGTNRDAGRICVISGRTGVRLFSAEGPARDFRLGYAVAALGDVDGDGMDDYGASARPPSEYQGPGCFVYSGANGKILFERSLLAETITPLGDLDRDGISDFVLANALGAEVYMGGTFQVKYALRPLPGLPGFPSGYYGISCAVLGDATGDAINDFAIGSPVVMDHDGPPGYVYVYSGASGTLLYRLQGKDWGDLFGMTLAALGDLDGDGLGDLAIGAPGTLGGLYFVRGRDGAQLDRVVEPPEVTSLANELEEAGDVNGNGCGDIFTTILKRIAPGEFRNFLWLIDGGTRELLLERDYGLPLSGEGHDWNGDDYFDFLMKDPSDPSVLNLYSFAPGWLQTLGTPCSAARGESPRLFASGRAHVGTDVELKLMGVSPGRRAFLLLGDLARTPLRRGPGGSGCSVLVSADYVRPSVTARLGCSEAGTSAVISIPDQRALAGTTFHAQWLVSQPGTATPLAATRTARITIEECWFPPEICDYLEGD